MDFLPVRHIFLDLFKNHQKYGPQGLNPFVKIHLRTKALMMIFEQLSTSLSKN